MGTPKPSLLCILGHLRANNVLLKFFCLSKKLPEKILKSSHVSFSDLDLLWVTGGYGGNLEFLSSTELIGPSGPVPGPELPIEVEQHCLVRLDETRVMLIGGFDNTAYETSANTHIYNFETASWSNGPALNQARKLLGCGAFKSAAHGGKTMVVVAGGYFLMDSVEFWDPTGSEGWIEGKSKSNIHKEHIID